jgi:hypothetical protein
MRKLRRSTEPAVLHVKLALDIGHGIPDQRRREQLFRGARRTEALHGSKQFVGVGVRLVAFGSIEFRHGEEDLAESGPAPRALRRKIRPAEEHLAFRR